MKYAFSCLVCLAAATVAAAAERSVGIGPKFKGPVGLQLYSLRADFARDVPSTIATVKGLGFKNVELAGTYDLTPEKFREQLIASGLKPVSGHFSYERYRDDAAGVARDAKTLGLEYAGCAWIPHDGPFTEQKCREAIGVFNHAGEVLAKSGIKFFYHNHGYEFQRFGDGTLLDLLMAETKPRWVHFEMDIFWVVHPGQDPVKLLERYGNRWALAHLKDMKKGVKTGELTGQTDVTNDVALGVGQMDIPAILKAAKKAGVKYYFIEDESPSVHAQLPVSLHYLENISW